MKQEKVFAFLTQVYIGDKTLVEEPKQRLTNLREKNLKMLSLL